VYSWFRYRKEKTKMATETFSGARARFKIDGVPVGFAAGVSGEEVIDYQPVDVLGKLEVREYVPVAYRCSLSAQIFRVINSSLHAFGDTGQAIMASNNVPLSSPNHILTSGDLEAEIEDRLNSGVTMAKFEGVKASGHSFDISARGIVAENISFVAIRMKDESDF
jgi:hypothetical protein